MIAAGKIQGRIPLHSLETDQNIDDRIVERMAEM